MVKQRIYIKLKAFDKRLLDKTVRSIVLAVKRAGSSVRGAVSLPRRIIKFTVNKSPHVDKKSREQFEMRIHKRLISLPGANSSAVQSLMGLQLPAGVDVELKLLMDREKGE